MKDEGWSMNNEEQVHSNEFWFFNFTDSWNKEKIKDFRVEWNTTLINYVTGRQNYEKIFWKQSYRGSPSDFQLLLFKNRDVTSDSQRYSLNLCMSENEEDLMKKREEKE